MRNLTTLETVVGTLVVSQELNTSSFLELLEITPFKKMMEYMVTNYPGDCMYVNEYIQGDRGTYSEEVIKLSILTDVGKDFKEMVNVTISVGIMSPSVLVTGLEDPKLSQLLYFKLSNELHDAMND